MKTNELMKYIHQKGQALVEFAIILPLFLMMFFTIAYGGVLFTDYLTLSNAARSAAHDAASVAINKENNEIVWSDQYPKVKAAVAKNTNLMSDAIVWNYNDGNKFHVERLDSEDGNYDIRVIVRADLDTSKSYLAGLAYRLIKKTDSTVISNFIDIEYHMFCPKND